MSTTNLIQNSIRKLDKGFENCDLVLEGYDTVYFKEFRKGNLGNVKQIQLFSDKSNSEFLGLGNKYDCKTEFVGSMLVQQEFVGNLKPNGFENLKNLILN